MLSELSRREKAANIKPDPDIDVFMKVTEAEIYSRSIHRFHVKSFPGLVYIFCAKLVALKAIEFLIFLGQF